MLVIEFLTTTDIANYAQVSAFSRSEDRITAYAHIQQEIQTLEAAIRALKVLHNSLSSISRLPAELLSRIFVLLVRSEDTMSVKRKPHWVGVSHVCSQWRHIALECPRLWSHIRYSLCPRWAMEMLERSKMAPITVEDRAAWGSCAASAGNNAVVAVLKQLARIEHLTLQVQEWPKLTELFSSLSGAAPLLHTFQITSDDSLGMLPETIFSGPGGAPQLRCLSLDGCSVHWKSDFLCSLTHLTSLHI